MQINFFEQVDSTAACEVLRCHLICSISRSIRITFRLFPPLSPYLPICLHTQSTVDLCVFSKYYFVVFYQFACFSPICIFHLSLSLSPLQPLLLLLVLSGSSTVSFSSRIQSACFELIVDTQNFCQTQIVVYRLVSLI